MTQWKFLWLWLPLAFFISLILIELLLPGQYYSYIVEENGLLELLQFLIMLGGFVIAAYALVRLNFKTQLWLAAWLGLAMLGCLYVAGEEVSWGQQFFKWATPEGWLAVNDQQETNLHNTSSWLDQKPRALIELGVIVGGLLLPLALRFIPRAIPGWVKFIAPPNEMALIACLYLVAKIADKTDGITHTPVFGRASEITELYIYYFIALYLYRLAAKIRQ